MEQDKHQAWLAELAALDMQRRSRAEPELASKELALRTARTSLAISQAAVQGLEAELAAERRRADEPDDG